MVCEIMITRGPNKGKVCGTVNSKCKHRATPPCICGVKFDRSTSYYRHIKFCQVYIDTIKPPQLDTQPPDEQHDKSEPVVRKKIKLRSKKDIDDLESLLDSSKPKTKSELADLYEKIREMKDEIQEIRDKPVNFINISVMGGDFFRELETKMGYDRAIGFLTQVAAHPVEIIKKLYLDNNVPENYPIACRNKNHFRYLNDARQVVDDQGGSNIGKVMSDRIKDAILVAANEVITSKLSDIDNCYQNYDIKSIQNNLTLMTSNDIVRELAAITHNPHHPFFSVEDKR